jgi:hypothetical protein
MIMVGWVGEILDVKDAFLHGDFEEGKNVYMGIPEGFDKYYDRMYYILLLLQTLYGVLEEVVAGVSMPILAWTLLGLVLWLSWIDYCRVVGQDKAVKKAKKKITD